MINECAVNEIAVNEIFIGDVPLSVNQFELAYTITVRILESHTISYTIRVTTTPQVMRTIKYVIPVIFKTSVVVDDEIPETPIYGVY